MIAVDPTSPFGDCISLGDWVRMNKQFTDSLYLHDRNEGHLEGLVRVIKDIFTSGRGLSGVEQNKIVSNVKDQELVKRRRDQMIKGALTLFKEKGFHRTTTREIAKASGFSIGTLYEYIRTKEDVLFLTVDAIYEKVRERIEPVFRLEHPSEENLIHVVKSYFYLMDDLQEEILILYQEVKSLKKETREYVLQKERDMVTMLGKVIENCVPETCTEEDAALLANNIFVQGHMWAFRRWILQKQYTLDEYVEKQINYFLKVVK